MTALPNTLHIDLCPDCQRRLYGDARPTMAEIKRAVAAAAGITARQIESDDKACVVVRARWIAMALCQKLLGHGTGAIARSFRKDYSSVCRALQKMQPVLDDCHLPEDDSLREWASALNFKTPRINYLGNHIGGSARWRKDAA